MNFPFLSHLFNILLTELQFIEHVLYAKHLAKLSIHVTKFTFHKSQRGQYFMEEGREVKS